MELADMTVSKTVVRKDMRVRIPPLAPQEKTVLTQEKVKTVFAYYDHRGHP